MDEQITTKNKQFFDILRKDMREIDEIDNVSYKRIVLACFIDFISSIAYPKEPVLKRIVKCIDKYSDWQDKNRISLQQLKKRLIKSSTKSLDNLKKYVEDEIKRKYYLTEEEMKKIPGKNAFYNIDGKYIPLKSFLAYSVDPTFGEMKALYSGKDEKGMIDDARYTNLFKLMRNSFIHEFGFTGMGQELEEGSDQAHYQVINLFVVNKNTKKLDKEFIFHLCFPTKMIFAISANIIVNLERDFIERGVNPWLLFKIADSWFRRIGD